MTPATLGDWLAEGPFDLALSSGFFGFFAHAGVVTALEDAGLRPAGLAGSSAGALVAGMWAGGMSAADIARELLGLRRRDFWDPWPGPGLLRGRKFRRRLETILPAATFEDCRARLAVSVHDVVGRRTRVLSSGALAPALHASCAVPALFHPVWLDGRPYVDGGVSDRAGVLGVPSGARVLHHHLASRSPWRKVGSASMEIPRRDGLVSLVVGGLPRSGPFRLDVGAEAFRAARDGARRAMDEPVLEGIVISSSP